MNRLLKYLFLTLLWGCVAGYIIYASDLSRRERLQRKVTSIKIDIADSSSMGYMVTAPKVHNWLKASKIKCVGQDLEQVDLAAIEQMIAANGFVSDVQASVAYQGQLKIRVRQHTPLVRLSVDGYDSYLTRLGYIFSVPTASSVYAPIVSGSYRPPVPAGYNGFVRAHIDTLQLHINKQIEKLEADKLPFFRRELENDRHRKALRRDRVKRKWWKLESAESFEKVVANKRAEKAKKRRQYSYLARQIELQIESICEQQEELRRKQKKLEKNYDDFMKLLTFVESIEKDDFWRSEFVQIVARTTPSGAMELEIVPRSGSHTILFGRIEQQDQKLEKLMRFYQKGLRSEGWDQFSTIDIRFKDQVVCRK